MAGIQTSKITTDSADDLVIDPATGKVVKVTSALEVDNLKTATISTDASKDLVLDPASGKKVQITSDLEVGEVETSKITAPAGNDLSLEPVAGKSVKVSTSLEAPSTTTNSITSSASSDLSLEPAAGKDLKFVNTVAANPGEIPVSVDNTTGKVKKLDASSLTELGEIEPGDWVVVQSGPSREDDTAGTVASGNLFKVDGENIGTSGPPPANPNPGDVTAEPGFEGGTGTSTDPYVLTPKTVSFAGGSTISNQLIKVSNQVPGAVLNFTDLSADAGLRFVQPDGVIDTDGTLSFTCVYNDTPSTAPGEGKIYEGHIKIGESSVFFRWDVTQMSNKTVFSPANAPTAVPSSVDFVSDGKFGTVSATWADGSHNLRSTDLLFSVNGGPLDANEKAIVNGNTISIAFNEGLVNSAGNGEVITGILETSTGTYKSVHEFVKNNNVDSFQISPLSSQELNSVVTSGNAPVTGTNALTEIATPVGGANPLTDVEVSVNNGSFTSSYPVTFNPGDDLQVRGTTGNSGDTIYTTTMDVGGTTAVFSASTGTSADLVQPQILTPPNLDGDEVDKNVTVTSNEIAVVGGGAVTHSASSWEVYETTDGATPGPIQTGHITTAPGYDGNTTQTYQVDAAEDASQFRVGNSVEMSSEALIESSLITNVELTEGWDGIEPPFNFRGQKIIYAAGKYVSVSGDRKNPSTAYSTDGITWQPGNSPESNDWRSVAYGHGKWIAVGADVANALNDPFMTSPDGINWTRLTPPGVEKLPYYDIVFGNGVFVATTNSEKAATSSDGVNWTMITLPISEGGRMAYGNGVFAMISRAGAAYSSNGSVWTETSPGSATNSLEMVYADGKFVSVGGGRIVYSTNGEIWTTSGTNSEKPMTGIAYGNGRFVAVGSGGALTSSDAVNWETTPSLPGSGMSTWQSVTYGSDKFVAVARTGTETFMWSTTGEGVAGRILTFTDDQDLKYFEPYDGVGNTTVVSVDVAQKKMTVLGGAWSGTDGTSSGALADRQTKASTTKKGKGKIQSISGTTIVIKELEKVFIGSDNSRGSLYRIIDPLINGRVSPPSDPVNPSQHTLFASSANDTSNKRSWKPGTEYEGDKTYFVRVKYHDNSGTPKSSPWSEYSGFKIKSSAPVDWERGTGPSQSENPVENFHQMAYGNGKFVCVQNNNQGSQKKGLISSNGKHWTTSSMSGMGFDGNKGVDTIAFGNGVFVTAGGSQNAWKGYSSDGEFWTRSDMSGGASWESGKGVAIGFGAGQFLMSMGSYGGGFVWSSTNGRSWTKKGECSGMGSGIFVYANGVWVAKSYKRMFYSTDAASSWTEISSFSPPPSLPDYAPEKGIAYGNGVWVAAMGQNQVAVTADPTGTWTVHNASINVWDIAYESGYFFSISTSGNIFYSKDGQTWTETATDSALNSAKTGAYVVGGNGAGLVTVTGAQYTHVWTQM